MTGRSAPARLAWPLMIGGALVVAAGAWLLWRDRPLPRPRNLLLVTLDTLRADRLGAYGSSLGLTPALDALAAEGAVFLNAYTPVPTTTPSHATIMTGRYPITHGVRANGSGILSPDEQLVSEILQDHGLKTAAVVSALVLASTFGLNQGFDLYYEEGIAGAEPGRSLWFDQRTGDKSVDRALAWLRAEAGRPFMLWVHLFDPHHPYEPPSPFRERFAQTPYNGEVAFTDHQVGRLVSALREMGRYDDTMIIVAGDHGESLGQHNELYHGIFVYDVTMRVPLIVRVPAGRRGVRIADLASTLDITPTVLEAMGIPIPAQMQGVSLLGAATRGSRVPARSIYLESIYVSSAYGWAAPRGLVSPDWKLIDLPEAELYDLDRDPAEKTNLMGSEPGQAGEMRSEYDQVRADLERSARKVEAAAIDDETRDRLLSLGYIAGEQASPGSRAEPDPKPLAPLAGHLHAGAQLVKKGEVAAAEEMFEKVLQADPTNKYALSQIARARAMQGKTAAAETSFLRAEEIYPDLEELYRLHGWTLMSAGRPGDAERALERGLERLPHSGHLHYMLGHARLLGSKWSAAREELELAARLAPGFSKPHYLLAVCLLQEGDRRGALGALERFLERDEDVESLFVDPYLAALRGSPEFEELVKRYL